MAFVIESLAHQSLIRIKLAEPVEKADGIRLKICLGQLLSARPKHKTVYMALCMTEVSGQADLPFVQILSNFAEIYHQWRKEFNLELFLVLDPALMPIARYLSESLVVPILFFASDEALALYIEKRTSDTMPVRPKWATSFDTGTAQNHEMRED